LTPGRCRWFIAPTSPLRANPRLLVALSGLHFVLFPIPVITLFWKDQIGMSLTDIMVLQAAFGLAVVLLEFPSGYLADRVGYRTSLLVGAVLWLSGWLAYSRGATFRAIVVAELLLGSGSAFVSGADRALLWVSLQGTGRSGQYPRWEGRARAASQTCEAASAAAGGWLYAVAPRLPVWLQVPIAALALGTVVALREAPRPRLVAHRSHLRRAWHLVRFVLWHHRRLQGAMALSVTLGLSTFVMVWLIQPYMQARGVPPAWFGPIWAAAHLWLAGVSLASARVAETLGLRAALLGCCLLIPLGYAGLAVSPSAWGTAFYLCFMTLRGLQGPILATVMQEDAPGEDRAGVLSLAALLFRLAFVLTGPPIGALVDRAGLEAALVVLAALFTAAGLAALALFTRAHRRPA
jgi:predicted MFS family arabinose efflux permease